MGRIVYAAAMRFEHALLFVKEDEAAAAAADRLKIMLEQRFIEVHMVNGTLPQVENALTFVLGGDGTFLSAAQKLYGTDIPMSGINLGHLGFLTELDEADLDQNLDTLLGEEATVEQRPYHVCTLSRQGKELWTDVPFINDAVIQRQPDHRMIQLSVTVRDQTVIQHTRADGLIIATPTGSTAYNLSTGGPILHPAVGGLVLAPICPHTLSFRPIVIPPFPVTMTLESEDQALLSLDGRRTSPVKPGDIMKIHQSQHKLTLRHARPRSFFTTLRHKLRWDV
jgi:NAD+ kinase